MLWSELTIQTLRESPAGIDSAATALLIRAGYRSKTEWLTLAQRSFRKIRAIAQSELGAKTGLEVIAVESYPATVKHLIHAESGDEVFVRCAGCGYTADLPVAISLATEPPADPATDALPEEFHTPGKKTIGEVSDFAGVPATSQMKSLVMVAVDVPFLALIRGDHQLSRPKLARLAGVGDVVPATAEQIREWFGADPGSLGPIGVSSLRIVADIALLGRKNMIAGANRNDFHLRNVTPERDFKAEFTDLRRAAEGDRCVSCGNALEFCKAVSAEDPEAVLTAAAGKCSDQNGLVLPAAMAPFQLIVTPVNIEDAAMRGVAEQIYRDALTAGIEVLLDDREERPGVKFKDADLIGIPYRITIGKKLATGLVEVMDRKNRASFDLAIGDALSVIAGRI
jgi:prolyl-tRNA synthetase